MSLKPKNPQLYIQWSDIPQLHNFQWLSFAFFILRVTDDLQSQYHKIVILLYFQLSAHAKQEPLNVLPEDDKRRVKTWYKNDHAFPWKQLWEAGKRLKMYNRPKHRLSLKPASNGHIYLKRPVNNYAVLSNLSQSAVENKRMIFMESECKMMEISTD